MKKKNASKTKKEKINLNESILEIFKQALLYGDQNYDIDKTEAQYGRTHDNERAHHKKRQNSK